MPKLKDDERWGLISSLKEKRAIFDEYCKTTAEKERHSKKEEVKSAVEGFKALLDDIAEHEAKMKQERKESQAADREEGEMEPEDSDSNQQDDSEEAIPGLGPDTTLELLGRYWGNDPRWKACPEDQRVALFEERQGPVRRAIQAAREAQQTALVGKYRALMQEKGVSGKSRWSKMKDAMSDDARYQAVPKPEREQLFRQYVSELQDAEQQLRKEERERLALEREMQLRMKQDEEEAERRQRRAAHSDAIAAFQALLGEAVKDPDAMWRDWKGRLERDPQGRASNPVLDFRDCEVLFREHVKALNDQASKDYRELLGEVIRPLFPDKDSGDKKPEFPAPLHTFEEAEKLLQHDNRFLRVPKDSRERLWRRYVEDFFFEPDRKTSRDRDPVSRRGRRAERDFLGARMRGEDRRMESQRAQERDVERSERDRDRAARDKDRERDRWHRGEREKEREKERSRRRHGEDVSGWSERKRTRV